MWVLVEGGVIFLYGFGSILIAKDLSDISPSNSPNKNNYLDTNFNY